MFCLLKCKIQLRKEQMGGKNYENFVVTEEEGEFDESICMRKILKNSVLNTIQRRHIRIHTKNINVFEQAFATIKSTTGISDIDEIVKIFIKLEERNFSLMTYVNKLNSDIEKQEDQCRAMEELLQERHERTEKFAQDRHAATKEYATKVHINYLLINLKVND